MLLKLCLKDEFFKFVAEIDSVANVKWQAVHAEGIIVQHCKDKNLEQLLEKNRKRNHCSTLATVPAF